MTTIQYLDHNRVQVISSHGLFVCDAKEINRQHWGKWSDTVMCFIPPYGDTFSDGVPINQYEDSYYLNASVRPRDNAEDNYIGDKSGTYFDDCVVCGEPTNGSRYCGPSCQLRDEEGEA